MKGNKIMSTKDEEREKITDDELKLGHLQLYQEPISRMSSISAIFKGFSAAILAGLASASFTDISKWALLIGLIPLVSFLCLDVYYLWLEKRLRYRYKMVATGKDKVDFLVKPRIDASEKKDAKAGIVDCLKSPSIWLFYIPIMGCAIALVVMKFMGKL